jgi:hypothetical protein
MLAKILATFAYQGIEKLENAYDHSGKFQTYPSNLPD